MGAGGRESVSANQLMCIHFLRYVPRTKVASGNPSQTLHTRPYDVRPREELYPSDVPVLVPPVGDLDRQHCTDAALFDFVA